MIVGDRLNLRPIEQKDMDTLRSWRNAYSQNFGDGGYVTKDQQKMFYEKYHESSTDRMFIIQLKDGTQIGTIALYNISTTDRTADVGRVILLDEHRGQGYAEEAVKLVVGLADRMRLYKVRVWAYLDNLDAIAVYSRAGFKAGRPRLYLERVNEESNWKAPVKIESYDGESGDAGYESQCTNIK
jgi:RimJ/RimL family protein N-acetyltransferase